MKYLVTTVYTKDDIRSPSCRVVDAESPAKAISEVMCLMFGDLSDNQLIAHPDFLWEYRGDTRWFATELRSHYI